MFENAFLSLSGYGRLYNMREQNGETYISLNLINEFDDSQSDDIFIKCHVDKNQFSMMSVLARDLANDKTIILKFDAKYSGFQQCYPGMSAKDPRFILHVRAELLAVHEYCIEVDHTPYWNTLGLEDDMVSHRLRA